MSMDIKVYDNGDHTCLVWLPAAIIPQCRGFAIRRTRTRGGKSQQDYLLNRVGFNQTGAPGQPQGSDKWPVQRYLWWDYDVLPDDVVSYQVIPAIGPAASLQLDESLSSPATPALKITGQCSPSLSAYFNKGIIASQWVARALDQASKGGNKKQTLTHVIDQKGNKLRDALGALLKKQILELLEEVLHDGGSIYAALYELNDPELFDALKALGERANLVLGNGAFKKGETDENAKIRQRLRQETQVKVFDRIVSSPHFAHNKFVVFCDSGGKPCRVLTGSTNFTETGLCTQANNGLIIENADVAQAYLEQWQRLQAAGNGFPASLKSADSQTKQFSVDGGKLSLWFTPTQNAEDLQQARQLINQAKDGILFLFFNPGTFQEDPDHWTLLQTILNRHNSTNNPYYAPGMYIRGVVNQQIPKLTEPDPGEAAARAKPNAPDFGRATGGTRSHGPLELDPAAATTPVALYPGEGKPLQRMGKDVLVPDYIRQRFATWDTELSGASMVMVHSKVVVLDPFGANPVVMTGSHNMGFKASSQNDDNMVIIEGNHALAAAYAVNIIAIHDQYRFRGYVHGHLGQAGMWKGLEDDDKWQQGHLSGDGIEEIDFFLGRAAPTSAAAPARTVTVAGRAHRTTAQPPTAAAAAKPAGAGGDIGGHVKKKPKPSSGGKHTANPRKRQGHQRGTRH